MGRREDIADAGIRCIARGGARALTHRAVDAEAGLPSGSTTYYAQTRRDLQKLVADRITEQLEADLVLLTAAEVTSVPDAAAMAANFLNQLSGRPDAQAARFALLFELRSDEEIRRPLTAAAPVRRALDAAAAAVLDSLHVPDPHDRAPDFVALVDALLLYRTADVGRIDEHAVLTAYLRGLQTITAPLRTAR
ncbi:MAG: hypothetical protein ABI130_13920 [Leifsonia sp.]